jgi:hypothetical protein
MLRPASATELVAKLCEVGEVSEDSPLHKILLNLIDSLGSLGFVLAREIPDEGPVFAFGQVISIFSAGRHYAPERMAALQETWPALYEALNNMLEGQGLSGEALEKWKSETPRIREWVRETYPGLGLLFDSMEAEELETWPNGADPVSLLVLEKWKRASRAVKDKVRKSNPELGLALDQMENGDR